MMDGQTLECCSAICCRSDGKHDHDTRLQTPRPTPPASATHSAPHPPSIWRDRAWVRRMAGMHAAPMPSGILSAVVPKDIGRGPAPSSSFHADGLGTDASLRGSSLREGWQQLQSAARDAFYQNAASSSTNRVGRGPTHVAFIPVRRAQPPEPGPTLPPSPKPLKNLRRITPLYKQ